MIDVLINERNPDVICISETWLSPDTPNEHIVIPSYSVYRCDKGRGGGACIYVKDIYTVNLLEPTNERPQGVEDVWVTIQSCKFPTIIVGCMYRHPKAHICTYDYIRDMMHSLSLKNKAFYILGDFNDDFLSNNSKLKHLISNTELTQLITVPTRITQTSSTLLDLIITNRPSSVIQSDTIPCPVADHELITVTLNLEKPKRLPCVKTFRDLSSYSPNIFQNLLRNEGHNLRNIFMTDDVDSQVTIFTDVFNKCMNKCAPMVTREVKRPFAPWIDENLKALMSERNKIQKQLKNDRHNALLSETYKSLKKQVKTLLNQSKFQYHNNKLDENKGNTAAIWDVLRQIMPSTKKSSPIVEDDINLKCKADSFNNFFVNVGKETYEKSQRNVEDLSDEIQLNPDNDMQKYDKFRPQPIDSETIILEIKHMKNTSSCGSDGIPLRFIKESLPVIIPFLTCILNTSIVTGTFPKLWKHALVVPIFKAGDSNEPKNYRPISLLSIISKLLEKAIARQLSRFLEENHLLSNTQHGFRSSLSTESALLTLCNKLYQNIDDKNLSLITLCDLSKAFDSVNHEQLKIKLAKARIDSFWFNSYLYNRTQSVRLNKTISDTLHISYGVSQGSVLGPILFSIYVNDLSQYVSDCLVIQYADDTQFVHTGNVNDVQDLIHKGEETLSKVKKYFNMNGLMLNTTKTQFMFVGCRGLISQIPPDTCFRVDSTTIVPSKSVKNLGVYFDTYMTFEVHINNLSRRVFSTILYINRIKGNLNRSARIIVTQSLVLSLINYAILIWGTANSTRLKQIQKMQNFAAKVALGGAAKHAHATPFIKELGWLKVVQKYLYELGKMVYNVTKGNVPNHLLSLPSVRDVCPVNTRQQHQLYVPRTKTLTGARSILVDGPKYWNSLPSNIRCAQSTRSFKKNLSLYLNNEQFNP